MPGPHGPTIPEEVHRQILGERLARKVMVLEPELWGVILGILVRELSLPDLYNVLECESERKRWVASTVPRARAEVLAGEERRSEFRRRRFLEPFVPPPRPPTPRPLRRSQSV